MIEKTYWIQKQAPAGNFYDYLGLSDKTKMEARKLFLLYYSNVGNEVYRLIERIDTPLDKFKGKLVQRKGFDNSK